jgi:hypothetical protein
MSTYTIYCLIDPRTNQPYYVGASWNKYSLANRLARHVGHANSDKHVRYKYNNITSHRHEIVYQLQEQSMQPIIKALFVTTAENVDTSEESAYNHLIKLGFALLQDKYRFCYNKRFKHGTTDRKLDHAAGIS